MSDTGSHRRKPLPVTDAQLHVMLHALGIQKRGGRWSVGGWRNDFVASVRAFARFFKFVEAVRGCVGAAARIVFWFDN